MPFLLPRFLISATLPAQKLSQKRKYDNSWKIAEVVATGPGHQ